MVQIETTSDWHLIHPGAQIGLLEISQVDNHRPCPLLDERKAGLAESAGICMALLPSGDHRTATHPDGWLTKNKPEGLLLRRHSPKCQFYYSEKIPFATFQICKVCARV